MRTRLQPGYDETATCDCPTHRTPGTLRDSINTRHVPSCQLYRAGDSVTRRYVAGTLDALLDAQFGVTR